MVRRTLQILGITCLVVAFMPNWRVGTLKTNEGRTETRRTFTLGLPFSPLFRQESLDTEARRLVRPDGGLTLEGPSMSRSVKLELVSWSVLLGVVSAVLMEVERRMKKTPLAPAAARNPSLQVVPSERQPGAEAGM